MLAYGCRSKTLYPFTDWHPRKKYENWWEFMSGETKSRKTNRMKYKKELKLIVIDCDE